MTQRGFGRLERGALSPVGREIRVTEVRVRQRVALEQPAHADARAVGLARYVPQAVAVTRIHRHRPVAQVTMRVLDVAHSAITDVLAERWLVEQRDDEGRVVQTQAPQ